MTDFQTTQMEARTGVSGQLATNAKDERSSD